MITVHYRWIIEIKNSLRPSGMRLFLPKREQTCFSSKEERLFEIMDKEFQVIAKNIKYLRENRGYTQEQLAEAANLSVSHLSKVESGKRRIGMKAYLNILQIMGVTEEEFATLATNEKKENSFTKFQDIIEDCNEAEKKFLLDTLKSIKENMKVLTQNEVSNP